MPRAATGGGAEAPVDVTIAAASRARQAAVGFDRNLGKDMASSLLGRRTTAIGQILPGDTSQFDHIIVLQNDASDRLTVL